MTLPYPDACISSFKYAIKGGNSVNSRISETLVPNVNVNAGFVDKIAGVLALYATLMICIPEKPSDFMGKLCDILK